MSENEKKAVLKKNRRIDEELDRSFVDTKLIDNDRNQSVFFERQADQKKTAFSGSDDHSEDTANLSSEVGYSEKDFHELELHSTETHADYDELIKGERSENKVQENPVVDELSPEDAEQSRQAYSNFQSDSIFNNVIAAQVASDMSVNNNLQQDLLFDQNQTVDLYDSDLKSTHADVDEHDDEDDNKQSHTIDDAAIRMEDFRNDDFDVLNALNSEAEEISELNQRNIKNTDNNNNDSFERFTNEDSATESLFAEQIAESDEESSESKEENKSEQDNEHNSDEHKHNELPHHEEHDDSNDLGEAVQEHIEQFEDRIEEKNQKISAIEDVDNNPASVYENAESGTAVGITVKAVDENESDTVTYSLSDDAGGRFTIDANTGVVTVADASQLDYESVTSHEIEVTATSSDGSTSTQTYTINLTDDTSEASVGSIIDTNADVSTISESVSNGTTVGITVSASDTDATDSVTFSLTDDANGRFTIDANTGVVTVADANQLDYESATSHEIEVTATSSDGSTSTQTYTINLTDDTSESSVSSISDANADVSTISEIGE